MIDLNTQELERVRTIETEIRHILDEIDTPIYYYPSRRLEINRHGELKRVLYIPRPKKDL